MADALFESSIKSLPLIARGKVRDIYAIDDDRMLIVTTDRLSAFDVILPDPIPGKGKVLTAVSNFWFGKLAGVSPNHLTGIAPESVVTADERDQVEGRAIVVRRLKPLPIEAVVRGYLIGSGWGDYSRSGAVCGVQLPHGLRMASKLPSPIFTPATKAAVGDHDENISYAQTEALIGAAMAAKVRGRWCRRPRFMKPMFRRRRCAAPIRATTGSRSPGMARIASASAAMPWAGTSMIIAATM